MKKRRKHNKCLNCNQNLQNSDNYCPNCGQENTDNEVGIGLLFREFTSNFFSFDSRFGRTLTPFLFRPGKITNHFNQGMRVFYANPIRWYLVISIFHFFFFSRVIRPDETKGRSFLSSSDAVELTTAEFDSLFYLPDSLHDDGSPISSHYYLLANEMNDAGELTPSEIMDSLKLNQLPFAERLLVKQLVKLNRESSASLFTYILRQVPIIMFFILPVYAFILKIFFWRNGLYIKHLIHSLHIHSFFFFTLGVAWIFELIIGDMASKIITPLLMLTGVVYILVSFKNVYKIKWRWTIIRFFLIGFLYFFVLTIALGTGLLISLVFF